MRHERGKGCPSSVKNLSPTSRRMIPSFKPWKVDRADSYKGGQSSGREQAEKHTRSFKKMYAKWFRIKNLITGRPGELRGPKITILGPGIEPGTFSVLLNVVELTIL